MSDRGMAFILIGGHPTLHPHSAAGMACWLAVSRKGLSSDLQGSAPLHWSPGLLVAHDGDVLITSWLVPGEQVNKVSTATRVLRPFRGPLIKSAENGISSLWSSSQKTLTLV